MTRTRAGTTPRRVVARAPVNVAPASGISSGRVATPTTTGARRVVARAAAPVYGGVPATRQIQTRVVRDNTQNTNPIATIVAAQRNTVVGHDVPATRCLADYAECMDGYCERADTRYNRCYCSARLAQIDSQYQPAINELVEKIMSAKYVNKWTDAEMNEYWMEKIGQYTGDNSWEKLDAALDIQWPDMASRVRGQNAFATGHEYCVQHLKNCFYMASNLRDAYRSQISRDCDAYEQSLSTLKNIAESIVGSVQ